MNSKNTLRKNSTVILLGCALAIWLGTATDAANRNYEVHPEISVGSQSNTVTVLDAYERLMDNYMSLVQSNLNGMTDDMSMTLKQLNSIDRKMDNIAARMARIERALNLQPGLVPPVTPPTTRPQY